MSYQPGTIPSAALVTIASGEQLVAGAANAYKVLVADAAKHSLKITPASPGAAYRTAKVQDEMRAGSLGNVELARKWDLNPRSSVPLAAHPNGTHEHGDRIDLLFNGSSTPTQAQIDLCEKHGWKREFGARDENHFQHDGVTDIHPAATKPATYQVLSGDTLTRIGERTGVDWHRIADLNGVKAPAYTIQVGQILKLR